MKRLMAIAAGALLSLSAAQAYDQPAVNLGFTSFLDGAPPAGPGFYFTEYLQYYNANVLKDAPINPDIKAFVSLNQAIYQSNQKVLFGGRWGLNVILPVVAFDSDVPNTGGLGDLNVGPFLQWDPIMGKNGPVMFNRIELTAILPTGNYEASDPLNAGSNFYSFNPYWSATWLPAKKCEVSWRLHYLWNSENDDTNLQPGQAVHLNLATSYEVLKGLRLGFNGYFFKQITDSEVNDVKQPGKEQVLGLGPGLLYSFSKDNHLFANAYFETAGESRTEGQRYVIRWVHHF